MKKNKLFPVFLFSIFFVTACVSHRPQYTSIQDGVRCPLANQKVAANSNPSKRTPASVAAKPSDQTCDQLFGQ